ncbi:hypothetical protein CSUB01_08014 [Colletotrichum sublineola]|uniref:Uncharacterized protein n=1 Tax=Colletotrichum sublineola TaxID=1173701 RepID=A0A066WSX3_COLSU|nr:hypothetical protein CSUB01_08014 [Colletotrichum sublineola]
MTEQEQSESRYNTSPLDLSWRPADPILPFSCCGDFPLSPTSFYPSPPSFQSTNQQYNDPETSYGDEPQHPEGSIPDFSASNFDYLTEEDRFVLNRYARNEPWDAIKKAYKNNFKSLTLQSGGCLPMRVSRLKKKHPEINNTLPVRRRNRQATRTSGADKVTAVTQQVSLEEAMRAAETVMYFLGQPDCDGLVSPDDVMAMIRILSQLRA